MLASRLIWPRRRCPVCGAIPLEMLKMTRRKMSSSEIILFASGEVLGGLAFIFAIAGAWYWAAGTAVVALVGFIAATPFALLATARSASYLCSGCGGEFRFDQLALKA